MNSRERILAAIDCRQPDRVPISTYELVGYNSRNFENKEPSYAALSQAIREKTDCLAMWNPRSNAAFLESSYPVEMDSEEYREDKTTVRRSRLHTPKGVLTQTVKRIDNIYTSWIKERWCKGIEDIERALSVPYKPLDFDISDYERIQNEVGDHGIIMASLGDPLLMAAELMEFGNFTIWAMTETDHFARTVERMRERCMENLKRQLDVLVVDLYRICGPEYATPPYLPPAFFERFVVPYVSEMTDLIHSKGGKVRLHCHGKIGKVLDMIGQTGADGLDPCEGPPDGDIHLSAIKRRVGNDMSLFGNVQVKLLEQGTLEEV